MKRETVILCVGGDARTIYMCEQLARDHSVLAYKTVSAPDGVKMIDVLSDHTGVADVLVLPMLKNIIYENNTAYLPCRDSNVCLEELILCLKEDALITGGLADDKINQHFSERGFELTDYFKRKELVIKNCIPTAEGALMIAMQEQPTTVFGSRVLITGYGNVAKAAARLFSAAGAKVVCAIRRNEAAAEAQCQGFETVDFEELAQCIDSFETVINTVPAPVIQKALIDRMSSDALIIDLASMPGGVDRKAASARGIRCIHALALPGKAAPAAAGRYLAETVENIISERRE